MLPKDLEELQARGKLNISEEAGSTQHQVWAKEGEDSGLQSPWGRTLLIALCPCQAPALLSLQVPKVMGPQELCPVPWL